MESPSCPSQNNQFCIRHIQEFSFFQLPIDNIKKLISARMDVVQNLHCFHFIIAALLTSHCPHTANSRQREGIFFQKLGSPHFIPYKELVHFAVDTQHAKCGCFRKWQRQKQVVEWPPKGP